MGLKKNFFLKILFLLKILFIELSLKLFEIDFIELKATELENLSLKYLEDWLKCLM